MVITLFGWEKRLWAEYVSLFFFTKKKRPSRPTFPSPKQGVPLPDPPETYHLLKKGQQCRLLIRASHCVGPVLSSWPGPVKVAFPTIPAITTGPGTVKSSKYNFQPYYIYFPEVPKYPTINHVHHSLECPKYRVMCLGQVVVVTQINLNHSFPRQFRWVLGCAMRISYIWRPFITSLSLSEKLKRREIDAHITILSDAGDTFGIRQPLKYYFHYTW